MRNIILKIVKTFAFLGILCGLLIVVNYVLARKYSYEKYQDFYTEQNNIDVLFFGTSHVINGIMPLELWNDYGITAYNMANHSEPIPTNYWQLVHALHYTQPKVVVIDLYAIDAGTKANTKYLHNFTDSMKFSFTKIRAITDILPIEEWAEYLFPLSVYHSRWDDDFSFSEINYNKNIQNGAELRTEVFIDKPPVVIPKTEYDPSERYGKEYLQKIVDLCDSKGIDVILTYLPYSAPESHFYPANWGYMFAQKNNIPYLNFLYEDVINYTTDCADEGSHLNISGAKKVTDYLGQYIVDNYNVENHSNDVAYSNWNDKFDKYFEFKEEVLSRQSDPLSFLSASYDKDFTYTVTWTKNSLVRDNETVQEFVKNLESISQVQVLETEPPLMNDVVFRLDVYEKKTGKLITGHYIIYYEDKFYLD